MATAPVSVNASIHFVLLKNEFVAAMESGKDGLAILLAPSTTQEKNEITVGEMIDEIAGMLGTGSEDAQMKELKDNLDSNLNEVAKPDEGQTGFKAIGFTLQQAFLYYEKKGTETKMEYAFSLSVSSGLQKDKKVGGLFQFKSASISVWNTDRSEILKSMKMFSIENYLKEISL